MKRDINCDVILKRQTKAHPQLLGVRGGAGWIRARPPFATFGVESHTGTGTPPFLIGKQFCWSRLSHLRLCSYWFRRFAGFDFNLCFFSCMIYAWTSNKNFTIQQAPWTISVFFIDSSVIFSLSCFHFYFCWKDESIEALWEPGRWLLVVSYISRFDLLERCTVSQF